MPIFYFNLKKRLIKSKKKTISKKIRKFSSFNPSTENPNSLEDLCKLWLNKIVRTVLDLVQSECEAYSKQLSLAQCTPHIFLNEIADDISISLSNGALLSALIVFYTCDADFTLSDICLQENVGFEESVENLNLIKEFCEKFIITRPFYFQFEDFLYSPLSMKVNKLAFIAELFYWFEVQPLTNFITPTHYEIFKDYIKSKVLFSFFSLLILFVLVFVSI